MADTDPGSTGGSDRWPPREHLVLPAVLALVALPALWTENIDIGIVLRPDATLTALFVPLVLVQTVPLWWRHRWPGRVLAVVGCGFVIDQLGGLPGHAASFAAGFALAAVVRSGAATVVRRAVVLSAVVLVTVAVTGWYAFDIADRVDAADFVFVTVLLLVVPVAVGWSQRARVARAARPPGPAPSTRPRRAVPHPAAVLSPRECEVLDLLLEGRRNAEIAAELHIGRETVKSHVARILQKLGARDRAEVIVMMRDRRTGDGGAARDGDSHRHAHGAATRLPAARPPGAATPPPPR